MRIIIIVLNVLLPVMLVAQDMNQEITPIGTGKGVLMAYNFPDSHFTLRVEGDNVRPAQRPYIFFVDNRALQLVTVDLKDVSDLSGSKNTADSLVAHQKYELKYLAGVLAKELVLEGHEMLKSNSKSFMFWHFVLPPEMKSPLERQLQMTVMIGDKLLILKTASAKTESITEFKNWMAKFAFTLIQYDKPIDIQKLIEQIKNE
jgi:hypothetical protein